MKSSDRVLFVHAGGGKTGSSALQSALAGSAEELAAIGVTYAHVVPAESHYTITSGNGVALFNLLQGADWAAEGGRLVESYLLDRSLGICSSEYFGNLSEDAWRRLIATAADGGIAIRAIFYVRSAISYLIASYNQDVKRAGECRDLADYVRDGTWHHFDALKVMEQVFADEQLCVMNYDAVRKDLIASFAGAFPELAGVEAVLAKHGNRTVNRSLDAMEIEVMKRVNARFGPSFSEQLSNKLIYEDPERSGALELPPEIVAGLQRKFEEPTQWVNERFLKQSGAALVNGAPPPRPHAPALDSGPYIAALDWALGKVEAAGGDAIGRIRDQLLNIDWQNSSHPDLPDDFDPIAYLLLNTDLMKAEARPFQHYLDSGKREERVYRWPLQSAAGHSDIADTITQAAWPGAAGQQGSSSAYLRQLYQFEGLAHSFVDRERSLLDELRREREGGKYSRAEFQDILSGFGDGILRSIRQSVEQLASLQATQSDQMTAQVLSQISALADQFEQQVEAVRNVREISMQLKDVQGENVAVLMKQGEQTEAAVQVLSNQVGEVIQSLRDERSQLVTQMEVREAEISRQEQLLSHYRTAGVWDFLTWSFLRRRRP